jgi:hypothetical protein
MPENNDVTPHEKGVPKLYTEKGKMRKDRILRLRLRMTEALRMTGGMPQSDAATDNVHERPGRGTPQTSE